MPRNNDAVRPENTVSTADLSLRPAKAGSVAVAVFGPGLVVMLADTDVGSVITAGQSGVQWGYRLLLLQLALIPILYMVQELTVRLGIFTGRGHGELIRQTFGMPWAMLSAAGLGVATVGALLTEFSGVAGVGELYGLSRALTLPIAGAALLAVVITGSYRRVERVAIVVGLFEFAFFFVAWAAHPDPAAMARGAIDIPFADKEYLYLAAANIGAVIMPWMIFYQQSAVADKRLRRQHFAAARWDTAIGAVVTQLVMAAVLIACAATIGRPRGLAGENQRLRWVLASEGPVKRKTETEIVVGRALRRDVWFQARRQIAEIERHPRRMLMLDCAVRRRRAADRLRQ